MTKLAPWALLAMLPLAACNSNPSDPMAATVPMPMPAVTSTSSQDQNFAMQAAMSDQFEIQASQMALQKSRSPAVQRFAQKMIDDHTMSSSKLMPIASAKGVAITPGLSPSMQQKIAVLDAANRTFDREYLAAMVSSHRDAVQVFETEARSGTDPDLKMAATSTLPMIQSHLAMARRLRA